MTDLTTSVVTRHAPVTTLAELDALDETEMSEGYRSTEKGDPEPGMNRSRAHHHGWRTRMMDLHEIEIPSEHRALTRAWVERERARKQG